MVTFYTYADKVFDDVQEILENKEVSELIKLENIGRLRYLCEEKAKHLNFPIFSSPIIVSCEWSKIKRRLDGAPLWEEWEDENGEQHMVLGFDYYLAFLFLRRNTFIFYGADCVGVKCIWEDGSPQEMWRLFRSIVSRQDLTKIFRILEGIDLSEIMFAER